MYKINQQKFKFHTSNIFAVSRQKMMQNTMDLERKNKSNQIQQSEKRYFVAPLTKAPGKVDTKNNYVLENNSMIKVHQKSTEKKFIKSGIGKNNY